jgi:hypothetical protein
MEIPWFLQRSRPGEEITLKSIQIKDKMKELELPSKSLLANVPDMEDDYRPSVPPPPLPPAQCPPNHLPPQYQTNHLHNHLSPPLSNHITHTHKSNGGLFRYIINFSCIK